MKTGKELRKYKRDWNRSKCGSTKESLSRSETWKGRRAEYLAMGILEGAVDQNSEVMNKDYDLSWSGNRVDVKSCNLYKRKSKRGKVVDKKKQSGWWTFNKNKGESDLYFCICMVDNIPVRYYLIPKIDFSNGITVGQKSKKFDKYLICINT